MNLEKTRLFQGSYFGKIMNNMKLSSRSQFPWNTIFGPLDDPLAQIGGQKNLFEFSQQCVTKNIMQSKYESKKSQLSLMDLNKLNKMIKNDSGYK